jgi:hypothetical protein
VDGKPVGDDETAQLTLKPGIHHIKIENRFLGVHEIAITVTDGQSGTVKIEW